MLNQKYECFLEKITKSIENTGIEVKNFQLDHIGYQCSSSDDYELQKTNFKREGEFVAENMVGGRRVGLFKLNVPIIYQKWVIPAIEVIEPKPKQDFQSGLEHVEFIIDEDFETFMKKYPELNWDDSSINQPKFPLLKLKLSDKYQVKFHHIPVLEIEKP